jgi:hypothetical protein
MTTTKTIEAVILDDEGYEIGRAELETIKAAKAYAKNALRDEWATASETTHAALRTHKAEVRVDGECVWDAFYKA